MPSLSLTDLVDVFSKAGTPRVTKVREIKNREAYSPATDYYRRFREGIVEIHSLGKSKDSLGEILQNLPTHKIENYSEMVEGYRKWWGRKSFSWFNPPKGSYSYHNFTISVNPELGVEIDGHRHVIKLYTKADTLAKNRVDLVHSVMELSLSALALEGDRLCVLDVRNSKIFISNGAVDNAQAIIDAELAYIETLWPSL